MSVRGGWDDRAPYRDPPDRVQRVTRYHIPREPAPEPERISIYQSDRARAASDRGVQETRIIRTQRESPSPERERTVTRITREVSPPEPRYERSYRVIEREQEPMEPRSRGPVLERYTKSTEYYPAPPRNQIVVAPPKVEEDYTVVEKTKIVDDRSLVRREPSEDEYHYRRTREVREPSPNDDYRETRVTRRRTEISPESHHSRHRDRDYSSDDSMVYVKRKVTEERDGSPSARRHLAEGAIAGLGAAEIIRHHRRKKGEPESGTAGRIGKDVGAAALGVIGAQAIARARSHRRSESHHSSPEREGRHRHRHREKSRSKSRVRQVAKIGLGAAVLGTAVAYAVRQRNAKQNQGQIEDRRSRSRTRRHSTSGVPDDDARNPGHQRKRIAQAGLAGAAITGLIERARSKSRPRDARGRSRSRVRQALPAAAVGLGSAAIAGLYEKNQAKKKDEQARQTARQVEKQVEKEHRRSRSRSIPAPYATNPQAALSDPGLIEYGDAPFYSNPPVPDYYNRPASQAGFYQPPQPDMVPAAAPYGQPTRVTETREIIRDESRSRSRGHRRDKERRGGSSESSDGERQRRHHRRRKSGDRDRDRSQSRTRDFATAAAAAGAAGLAATEYQKRKQKKREEKERIRLEAEQAERYNENYNAGSPLYSPPLQPPPVNSLPAAYTNDNYYPSSNSFPPPPIANAAPYNPAPYNPADYVQGGQQIHPDYYNQGGYIPPEQSQYQPPVAEAYAQAAPPGRARRGDENVSAAPSSLPHQPRPGYAPDYSLAKEGVNPTFPPPPPNNNTVTSLATLSSPNDPPQPTKSVQFDDSVPSPAELRRKERRKAREEQRARQRDLSAHESDASTTTADETANPRRRRGDRRDHQRDHHDHRRRRSYDESPTSSRSVSPAGSDRTEVLPDRFDAEGRIVEREGDGEGGGGKGDPIAAKIEAVLAGKGTAGKLFKSLTKGLLGEEGEGEGGRERDRGGRRRRR